MDTLTKLAIAQEKRSQGFWLTMVGVGAFCSPFAWISPGKGGMLEGIVMFCGVVTIISGIVDGQRASKEISNITNAG